MIQKYSNKGLTLLAAFAFVLGVQSFAQQSGNAAGSPIITGAMKNVMLKGQRYGTIDIDTISNKQHIYGLGPIEYLAGEILLVDGKGYKSVVVNDTTMLVTETFAMKAPFLGYANIKSWTERKLPDSISTLQQLENYLDLATKNYPGPFLFQAHCNDR